MPKAPEKKPARSSLANSERAFVAASRRSDRSFEARKESAVKASEIHYKRFKKHLRITDQIVMDEEMYEEEEESLERRLERLGGGRGPAAAPGAQSSNPNIADYLAAHSGTRDYFRQQLQQPPADSPTHLPTPNGALSMLPMYGPSPRPSQPMAPQYPLVPGPQHWQPNPQQFSGALVARPHPRHASHARGQYLYHPYMGTPRQPHQHRQHRQSSPAAMSNDGHWFQGLPTAPTPHLQLQSQPNGSQLPMHRQNNGPVYQIDHGQMNPMTSPVQAFDSKHHIGTPVTPNNHNPGINWNDTTNPIDITFPPEMQQIAGPGVGYFIPQYSFYMQGSGGIAMPFVQQQSPPSHPGKNFRQPPQAMNPSPSPMPQPTPGINRPENLKLESPGPSNRPVEVSAATPKFVPQPTENPLGASDFHVGQAPNTPMYSPTVNGPSNNDDGGSNMPMSPRTANDPSSNDAGDAGNIQPDVPSNTDGSLFQLFQDYPHESEMDFNIDDHMNFLQDLDFDNPEWNNWGQ